MAFGLARLLQRTSHQALRIQELEQKLAELKSQKRVSALNERPQPIEAG
jgi:hypothetical protein